MSTVIWAEVMKSSGPFEQVCGILSPSTKWKDASFSLFQFCVCLYMLAEEILGVELLCQRICVFLILIDASFKLGYTTITNSFSLKQQRFISSSLAIVD